MVKKSRILKNYSLNPSEEEIKQSVGDEFNVWITDFQNNGNRRINRKFWSGKPKRGFCYGGSVFSKNPKLGSYGSSKPNFRGLYRRNNMQNAFHQGKIGAQLNWLAPLSCVVVSPWWGRLKILQLITILPLDLVLINVLSVTLEIWPRMLPKRMFKSLVMFCLIPVSLLSGQTLKCLNFKLPSHVNMGVLKKASLKISWMKISCLELLSVFLRS